MLGSGVRLPPRRPVGPHARGYPEARQRAGLEEFLSEAGFRYFFMDTHMAEAGEALGWSGDVTPGAERFDAAFEGEPKAVYRKCRTVSLSGLLRGPARKWKRPGRFREGARGFQAGLEPTARVSGGRFLPGVPQDPLAQRT